MSLTMVRNAGSYVRSVNVEARVFDPLARHCNCSMSKAGGRTNGRRLIRLLSAGWVPHDQGSSRGFLCLVHERGLSRLIGT